MTKTITLYNFPASIHAQYARVVLDEVGFDYNKVNVELPFDNLKPEYAIISDQLSVPAMTIVEEEEEEDGDDNNNNNNSKTYTDSRDIIMYCSTLPNSERLFPKDKMKDIEEILDHIYSANGGRIAFQSKQKENILFSFALDKLGIYRKKLIHSFYNDPKYIHLKSIYEAAIDRSKRSDGTLNSKCEIANNVILFLDSKLEQSNGNWLLGNDYTAADGVAAIWLYWIVNATNNTSSSSQIILSSRVLNFLERAKQRPAWTETNVSYTPTVIMKRLYIATTIIVCSTIVGTAFLVKKLKK